MKHEVDGENENGKNNKTDAHNNENTCTRITTSKVRNHTKNSNSKPFNYDIFITTTIRINSDTDYSTYYTYCNHSINKKC